MLSSRTTAAFYYAKDKTHNNTLNALKVVYFFYDDCVLSNGKKNTRLNQIQFNR